MTASWPLIPLGSVLRRSDETIAPQPLSMYQEITVRLWGKGVIQRRTLNGAEISGGRRFVARSGQFILSRIDARNGALGVVPSELDGALVSNDFPVFDVATDRLAPAFLGWLVKTEGFVELCRRASEGTTNRVRLQEQRFLKLEIQLPPLEEQRRIAERVEAANTKLNEARDLAQQVHEELELLLRAAYHDIADTAPRQPLAQVAPLTRRPVVIESGRTYLPVAARSFGRGTFQKPVIAAEHLTWQKLFRVRSGDILISNIKAWEGAIAVAGEHDDGCCGSHRYLTCLPAPESATAGFLVYHLLTPEGLHAIGEASPGSADRNRTLSAAGLQRILVPVPPLNQQRWFDALSARVSRLWALHDAATVELNALLPSILVRAFKGQL